MKLENAAMALAICMVVAGCGSHSSQEMAAAQPLLKEGHSGAVRAGVAQQEVKIAGYRNNFAIARDEKTGLVTLTNKISPKAGQE